MNGNILQPMIDKSEELNISLEELFSIVKWIREQKQFDYETIGDIILDKLKIYDNLNQAVSCNVSKSNISDLLDLDKDQFFYLNNMFELQSCKVVEVDF